jgi:hypothetical protein
MSFVSGYSYGAHTGSLAYPLRTRNKLVWRQELLSIVVELVHPGNLGALPPSPSMLAYKGEQIGIAKYAEFSQRVWY